MSDDPESQLPRFVADPGLALCPECGGKRLCPTCGGSGRLADGETCYTCWGEGRCWLCAGTGQVEAPVTVPRPGYQVCDECGGRRYCAWCRGRGRYPGGEPCPDCGGTGRCSICLGLGQILIRPLERGDQE